MKAIIRGKHVSEDFRLKAKEMTDNSFEYPDYQFIKDFMDENIAFFNEAVTTLIKGLFKIKELKKIKIKSVSGNNQEILLKSYYDKLQPFLQKYKGTFGDISQIGNELFQKNTPIINPESGKPLTLEEWERLGNQIDWFFKKTLGTYPEQFSSHAFLLGHYLKTNENEKIKDDKLESIQNYYSDWPQSLGDLKELIDMGSYSESAYQKTVQRIGQYISGNGEYIGRVKSMINKNIVNAIENKLTKQQLISNLYFNSKQMAAKNLESYEEINRDWRRVAVTESSFAINDSYLGSATDEAKGKRVYMIYSGRVNPKEKPDEVCNCFLGEIVRLITPEEAQKLNSDFIRDTYARRAIWVGKNRIGKNKKDNWIACPSHPGCTHFFKRIDPDTQMYDKKTNTILFKVKDQVMNLEDWE